MSDELQQLLQRHVDSGTIPGGVAGWGADEPQIACAGVSAIGGPAMTADAVFRIQSMTKVVTSVAALRLVERGAMALDDPIDRWLPELGDRVVLRSPAAALGDTEPALRPITLRHLLTNQSGYGIVVTPSPLQEAMAGNDTGASALPDPGGADDWLRRMAELPLAFHPGDGWRYHHSFAILGILLTRVTGRFVGDHLAEDLFGPLGMTDTGYWADGDRIARLPAGYRYADPDTDDAAGFVEVEPAAGGSYAGRPPYDVSHGELVSTLADFHRFARALATNAEVGGAPLLSAEHRGQLATDQIPAANKTADSFFPGFWESGIGWGFGVAVEGRGEHAGRFGWSGGLGTDFYVDPDATVGLLLTQVEMGERIFALLGEFQQLRRP